MYITISHEGHLFYVRSASRHSNPEDCFNHHLCESLMIDEFTYGLQRARGVMYDPRGCDMDNFGNNSMIYGYNRQSEYIIIPTIAIALVGEVKKPKVWI